MTSVIHAIIMNDVIANPCFVVAPISKGANQIRIGTARQSKRLRLRPRVISVRRSRGWAGGAAVVTSMLKRPPP